MSAVRKDYILNQIDLLRQFVARLLNKRDPVGLDDALQLAFHLQEKLLPLPAPQFLQLEVSDQIAALKAGEPRDRGHEKCLTYARLLAETATLYRLRDRDDLAAGARQLALHVALHVAVDTPANPAPATALITDLNDHLERSDLHPPVLELLEEYERLS